MELPNKAAISFVYNFTTNQTNFYSRLHLHLKATISSSLFYPIILSKTTNFVYKLAFITVDSQTEPQATILTKHRQSTSPLTRGASFLSSLQTYI